MNLRIRTSEKVSVNLEKVQNKLRLSSKAAILRLCISVSLKDESQPELELLPNDKTGFDISLATLFGDYETLYKGLILHHANEQLNEKDYVKQVLLHIERGMIELYGEFATSNSVEQFVKTLMGEA